MTIFKLINHIDQFKQPCQGFRCIEVVVHFFKDQINKSIDLFIEFFQGFVNHAQVTLHVDNLRGDNTHHQAETVFKAFGRALLFSPITLRGRSFANRVVMAPMTRRMAAAAPGAAAHQDDDGLFGDDNVFAVDEQFDRSVLEAQAEAQRWIAARR